MHHSQLLKHRCAWPGCAKLVPLSLWGCREHWYTLPRDLRMRIVLAYARGIDNDMHPTSDYIEAYRAAREWIEAQFSEVLAHNRQDETQEAGDARRDLP